MLPNLMGMKTRKRRRPRVIVLRRVGLTTAKREILDYLGRRRQAYPSDIALGLRLDLDLTFRALQELLAEGKVR